MWSSYDVQNCTEFQHSNLYAGSIFLVRAALRSSLRSLAIVFTIIKYGFYLNFIIEFESEAVGQSTRSGEEQRNGSYANLPEFRSLCYMDFC